MGSCFQENAFRRGEIMVNSAFPFFLLPILSLSNFAPRILKQNCTYIVSNKFKTENYENKNNNHFGFSRTKLSGGGQILFKRRLNQISRLCVLMMMKINNIM